MKIFLFSVLLWVLNFRSTTCLGNYPSIFVNSSSEDTVVTFNTSNSGGYLGFSVNKAGDFNGDGYQDLIMSSIGSSGKIGIVYVIYGGKNSLENIDLTSGIDSSQGFMVTGASAGDYFGISANKAGDINGDEIDDIIIGAYYLNSRAGAVYVIYGKKGSRSNIDLSSGMASSQGFTIAGLSSYAYLGMSATWAGDINGDKMDDIIVGASGTTGSFGVAFVIYGSKTRNGDIDLSSGIDSAQGFSITGASVSHFLGYSANYAGDVNADGIDDIIVGAYGVNSFAGAVYVVYGKKTSQLPNIDLSNGLSNTQGFAILGANPADYLGISAAGGQDTNGDGIDDIILGAYLANNKAGVVYVIFGKKGGLSNITLSSGLAPAQGYTVEGRAGFQRLGYSARFAGDINRDGISDLLIGNIPINETGSAIVIFGNKTVVGNISLSQGLSATQGYVVYGTGINDTFGRFVNGVGDMNHDGIDDIFVGAPSLNSYTGAAYIVYSPYLCPENCKKCSWSWVCQQCESGYGLYEAECVICPEGTTLKDGVCAQSGLVTTVKTASTILGASSVAGRAVSVGSSVSVGLGLIAKVIQNVRYLNISYSEGASAAFESYGSELFDFTIPTYFLEGTKTKSLPEIYEKYSMKPTFLENYLQSMIMMFICLCLFLPTKFLLHIQKNINKKGFYHTFLKIISTTALNFLIIQVYSNLDDVMFYLILDIQSTEFSTLYAIVSLFIGILFLLIGLAFCCFNYWLLFRYQRLKLQEDGLVKFKKKFEMVATFYEDFKDGSVFQQSFFALLVLRSALIILIMSLFGPPLIQSIIIMSINVIFGLYLIFKRPFESLFNEITQYFCELSVFVAYTCVFIYSLLDYNEVEATSLRKDLGKCIILTGTVLSLGGSVIQVTQILKNLYQSYILFKAYLKNKKNKKKMIPTLIAPNRFTRNSGQTQCNVLEETSQQIELSSDLTVMNMEGNVSMKNSGNNNVLDTDSDLANTKKRKVLKIKQNSRRINIKLNNETIQLQTLQTQTNALLRGLDNSMNIETSYDQRR